MTTDKKPQYLSRKMAPMKDRHPQNQKLTPDEGPAFLATMLSPSDPYELLYRLSFTTRFRIAHYGHGGVVEFPREQHGAWGRTISCDQCEQWYERINGTWTIDELRTIEWDGAGAFGDATLPLHITEEPYLKENRNGV